MTALAVTSLPIADQRALEEAVALLEQPSLAIRIANVVGKPFDGAVKLLPGINGVLKRAVHRGMLDCLAIAIESRDGAAFEPSKWRGRTVTAVTGGLSGLFGGALLPLELPLTITLMMRAITDIASHEGEDLQRVEARLACLQVFALTDHKDVAASAIGYFQTRAALARLTGAVVASLAERGALDASAPVVTRLVSEVVARFGFVVSERVAAGAVPIIGALGGASLNVMFMDHFERVARGHFTVRRLERRHGAERVGRLYGAVLLG